MSNKPNSKFGDQPVPLKELSTAEMHELSHKRDEICVPIAHFLIQMIASMDKFPVGSHIKQEEAQKAYLPVVRGLMTKLVDNKVKIADTVYIFNIIRQGLGFVEDAINETLNQNMNRVTELVYGLPVNDFNEVDVAQLNNVVMKAQKLSEVWKPILDEKIEEKK